MNVQSDQNCCSTTVQHNSYAIQSLIQTCNHLNFNDYFFRQRWVRYRHWINYQPFSIPWRSRTAKFAVCWRLRSIQVSYIEDSKIFKPSKLLLVKCYTQRSKCSQQLTQKSILYGLCISRKVILSYERNLLNKGKISECLLAEPRLNIYIFLLT